MSISNTPPSGFRDFTPKDASARFGLIQTIVRVYRSFGFEPIMTSAVEDLAVLTGKGGGENEKLIFKILKRGDKLTEASAAGSGELADLGLRFDLTLPLARFYSHYGGTLPKPFKVFQIGPVWRAERAQKGRYREFYQCDVDILGCEDWMAEVEVIEAISSALGTLGISSPEILINDRRILFAMLDDAKVPHEKRIPACIWLDKLDKMDPEDVWAGLYEEIGRDSASLLRLALDESREGTDGLARLCALPGLAEPVERLSRILQSLKVLLKGPAVRFEPCLVRGLDYYTGSVFEFRHPSLGSSLAGGGRYDRLVEKFGGQPVACCGGSIGFERLMLILQETAQQAGADGPQACVTVFSDELRERSLDLAQQLRAKGISVDVYPGAGKLKNQFKYADSKNAAYALVVGPDELASGLVKAKNLKTG